MTTRSVSKFAARLMMIYLGKILYVFSWLGKCPQTHLMNNVILVYCRIGRAPEVGTHKVNLVKQFHFYDVLQVARLEPENHNFSIQ